MNSNLEKKPRTYDETANKSSTNVVVDNEFYIIWLTESINCVKFKNSLGIMQVGNVWDRQPVWKGAPTFIDYMEALRHAISRLLMVNACWKGKHIDALEYMIAIYIQFHPTEEGKEIGRYSLRTLNELKTMTAKEIKSSDATGKFRRKVGAWSRTFGKDL
jgi:hypothetical protein